MEDKTEKIFLFGTECERHIGTGSNEPENNFNKRVTGSNLNYLLKGELGEQKNEHILPFCSKIINQFTWRERHFNILNLNN